MRKTLAILISVFFAIEIAIIEFSIPQVTQILFTSVLISLLFYLILKTEGLINFPQIKKLLPNKKVPAKSKKIEAPKKEETKKVEDKKEPQNKEEEESEFMTQWHELEKAAGK